MGTVLLLFRRLPNVATCEVCIIRREPVERCKNQCQSPSRLLIELRWPHQDIKLDWFTVHRATLSACIYGSVYMRCHVERGTLTDDGLIKYHHVQQLNEAMCDAAQSAGCVPWRVFKPKPYGCPELSQPRDRKQFWWKIWVENGRPWHGAVFDC